MHVIVYCGYEGIDHVLWAGDEGAREACLRIRERITDNVRRAEKRLPPEPDLDSYGDVEDWHVAVDEWYKLKEEVWSAIGDWFWESLDNADRMCVMKDVGDFEYRCCCEELGVGTEEGWLY